MSTFTYVHVWPILDTNRPRSALIAEACRELDIKAQLAGAKIIGEPAWHVSDANTLVCRAAAVPLDPNMDAEEMDAEEQVPPPGRSGVELHPFWVARIRELAAQGLSRAEIARTVGVSWTSADRYLRRAA